MSRFTLHLVNRIGHVGRDSDIAFWNGSLRRSVQSELQRLFNAVISDQRRLADPVTSARVQWSTRAGAVRSADLVVYFSADRNHGAVRRVVDEARGHSHTGQIPIVMVTPVARRVDWKKHDEQET